jgi:hypothetical protein
VRRILLLVAALFAMLVGWVVGSITDSRADGIGLSRSQTAAMRHACEGQLRRICGPGEESYENVKACIQKAWDKLDNECQYQITSLVPLIQQLEERKARMQARQ